MSTFVCIIGIIHFQILVINLISLTLTLKVPDTAIDALRHFETG